ncbi:MAG: hypothetical protein R3E78_05010 [Burkholderiaceae bacterium]
MRDEAAAACLDAVDPGSGVQRTAGIDEGLQRRALGQRTDMAVERAEHRAGEIASGFCGTLAQRGRVQHLERVVDADRIADRRQRAGARSEFVVTSRHIVSPPTRTSSTSTPVRSASSAAKASRARLPPRASSAHRRGGRSPCPAPIRGRNCARAESIVALVEEHRALAGAPDQAIAAPTMPPPTISQSVSCAGAVVAVVTGGLAGGEGRRVADRPASVRDLVEDRPREGLADIMTSGRT